MAKITDFCVTNLLLSSRQLSLLLKSRDQDASATNDYSQEKSFFTIFFSISLMIISWQMLPKMLLYFPKGQLKSSRQTPKEGILVQYVLDFISTSKIEPPLLSLVSLFVLSLIQLKRGFDEPKPHFEIHDYRQLGVERGVTMVSNLLSHEILN